ncbi:MAG TPA: DUF1552 domain-containing protein [Marinagarivorans sp.]
MKRRSLFKAIAAGSLTAANPLACLLARNAMAQNGTAPIRTIFLFHPNGADGNSFFPSAGSRSLPPMTAPMQSVYDNLVFIDGIAYAGAANTHEGGSVKCLTGRLMANDPHSSIDVLMGKEDWANRATNGISVPSVQMGVGTMWGNDANKRISHDGGTTLDSACDPRIVYPRLFGAAGSVTDGPNAGAGTGGVETQMLSAAKNDLARIQSQIGNLDGQRERLQQHAEALSVLEASFAGGGSDMMAQACNVIPDISEAPIIDRADTDEAWSQTEILPMASDLQQNIAVAALSCGITKTMAFSYGVSVSPVRVPGSSIGDHDASHSSPAVHTSSKVWWMGEVAKFIQKLANTPDVNGSLLDNTIIVSVSDLGHGNYHDHWRIPMFLASGVNNNVGLVTGRSLDWKGQGTVKVIGDGFQHPSFNHTDVLDTIRQVAGYTSFEMPNKEGDIMAAWRGGALPR